MVLPPTFFYFLSFVIEKIQELLNCSMVVHYFKKCADKWTNNCLYLSLSVVQYKTYEKNAVFNIFQDHHIYLLFTTHSTEIQA
jgi:hypothetical protein